MLDYKEFCVRAGKSHDRINTVILIAKGEMVGAWARPGHFGPDQKTIEGVSNKFFLVRSDDLEHSLSKI